MAEGKQTAVREPRAFDRFIAQLELDAEMDAGSNGTAMLGSVEAILIAETEEEMWAADARGPMGGRDLADVEMRVLDFQVKYSRNQDIESPFRTPDGKRMYLLIRAVRLSDGEEITWNTSAPLVVAKLYRLYRDQLLPAEVVIRATDLGGGQAVLKLEKVPQRVVK